LRVAGGEQEARPDDDGARRRRSGYRDLAVKISTPSAAADSGAPAAEPAERLAPGALVADRYRVVSFLDEGAMGAVYRVEHQHMRKAFALKVLHHALLSRPEIVARFEREARAAGSIDHPNVAAATDFGRLPDGSFFLILEFVRGRNLRDEVAAGALEPERAARIVRGIVAGVGAAHAKGIVHRDLKPENIMLVEHDGDPDFVKVLDFGIAKIDSLAPASSGIATPLTRMGALMGTLEYMSPEQAMGNPVDARSDLYSIGVIFYELLSGQCPFEGDAVRLIQQHVLGEVPPLPVDATTRLDPRIPRIVSKLLAKQPEERFATAGELGVALSEVSAPPRVVVPPPQPAPLSARERLGGSLKAVAAAPRAVRLGAGVLVLTLAAIALIAGALHRSGNRDASAGTAEPAPAPESLSSAIRFAPAATSAPPALALPRAPTPADSASAPAPPPRSAPAASAAGSAAQAHRKTGPGGIYIPPPKDWFR
jgi:tRNA A-37 threonylcarbamoyl transferase component Bud32